MIRVQEAPFDPAEAFALQRGRTDVGGLTTFVGYVRDLTNADKVSVLELQHYPGFTEAEIEKVADEARTRFAPLDLMIIHRYGRLHPSEPIVLVAAIAAHRDAAFDTVRFVMDYLKTGAPFWKKEHGPDGARWIEPRASDHAAKALWEADTFTAQEQQA